MKISKRLIVLVLTLAMCFSVLAMTASADDEYYGDVAYGAATTTASLLNIRGGCGTDYEILGTIPYGSVIVVLDCTEDGWYHINYNGIEGYCCTDYLADVNTAEDITATGMITGDEVCLRALPNTSCEVLGYYYSGTRVQVTGINDGWYRVSDGGIDGYVRSDLMVIAGGPDGSAPAYQSGETTSSSTSSNSGEDEDYSATGMLTADEVRLRTEPNTDCGILGYYYSGTRVQVIATNNGWYKISDGGQIGYIRADLMTIVEETDDSDDDDGNDSSSSTVSTAAPAAVTYTSANEGSELGRQIADYALQFVGYDYVYGGASPSEGFDCSGFVMYVYEQFGVYMPHGATSQYICDLGYVVSKADLQPGDLVFFNGDGDGISHVGMYIGDGQIVHASGSTVGVIISDLSSSYYTAVYYSAKRFI